MAYRGDRRALEARKKSLQEELTDMQTIVAGLEKERQALEAQPSPPKLEAWEDSSAYVRPPLTRWAVFCLMFALFLPVVIIMLSLWAL
jgi:hypothetical protein